MYSLQALIKKKYNKSTLQLNTHPPQTDLLFKFFLSFKYNVDFELQRIKKK